MITALSTPTLIALLLALLALACGLLLSRRPAREPHALESEIAWLREQLFALGKGALGFDRRLAANEDLLKSTLLKVEQVTHQVNTPGNYQWAIKRAAAGARSDELMNHYGLSRGEADLLTEMNGKPALRQGNRRA